MTAEEKAILDLEEEIKITYREAERDINNKISEFTRKYNVKKSIHQQQVKSGEWTQEDFDRWLAGQAFQSKQWKSKRDQIIKTISTANTVATELINGKSYNVFANSANYQAYKMEHKTGVNFGFGLYDSETVAQLLKDDPTLLPKWKINEPKDYIWNQKRVNNAVRQGIIQGERLDQITKRIADGLVMKNKNKSLTFARTSMTEAQNAGRYARLDEAKRKGIDVVKIWMATLDGRTRDSHRHLDGETLHDGDEVFSNGCRFPGDPEAPAREVFNCRCTLVGDVEGYPAEYTRRDNINGEIIRGMTYDEWHKAREAEKLTGVHTKLPTPEKFKKDFDIAKSTLPKGGEWRVDDTYTVSDYEHKRLYELDGGSVVAIAEDGDIVSVCKRQWSNKEYEDRGSNLLKVAIANGGDRLDAFGEGLYSFYTRNGFEPVSWTPFNEEYAPHDWVKGRDEPEEVVFYMYTGKQPKMTYEEFILNTPASDEYDDAKEIRNKLIDDSK